MRNQAVQHLAATIKAQQELAKNPSQPGYDEQRLVLDIIANCINHALENIAQGNLQHAQALLNSFKLSYDAHGCCRPEITIPLPGPDLVSGASAQSDTTMGCGTGAPLATNPSEVSGSCDAGKNLSAADPEKLLGSDASGCLKGLNEVKEDWQCNYSKGATRLPSLEDAPSVQTQPEATHPASEPAAESPAQESARPHEQPKPLDNDEDDNPPASGTEVQKPLAQPQPEATQTELTSRPEKLLTPEEKEAKIDQLLDKAVKEIAEMIQRMEEFMALPNCPDRIKAQQYQIFKNLIKELEDYFFKELLDLENAPTRPQEDAESQVPINLDNAVDPAHAEQRAISIREEIVSKVFEHINQPLYDIPGEYYVDLNNSKIYRDSVPPERRPLTPENEKWAEAQYELIRNLKDDIKKIAKNTGLPESVIEQIKNHVFFEEHHKTTGFGRFDADPEIVSAWDRLYQGDFIENDIDFLKHEYAEFILMKEINIYKPFHKALNDNGLQWTPPKYEG